MEVVVVCFVGVWLLRIAAEDIIAAVRGTTSPRITRKRARQEMAQASGIPTVGQAAAARIATVIAPSPTQAPPRRHPAWEYLRTRWEDAWDELLESHHEEMRRRAQQRQERQERAAAREAREAERLRREREEAPETYDDDIIDAEVVEQEPCPDQPAAGWQETTGGAERADFRGHEDQDGDAYYRRWVQPHPSGDGSLRTTVASWAQDDGTRRWIVTLTVWDWIGDDPDDLRFAGENAHVSDRDGPAGEPWPTAEDVRRNVEDIQQPAAPAETPLADVLDASLCPGGCGTWVVGGLCATCENRRALPPAPETPEPEQGPASTTQQDTDSGSAAHQEGTTTMPGTAYINPDIVDATGALACAEGALAFTVAVRRQMEKLGANAQRGLRGDVPAVREIRMFEGEIAATAATINALVEEHITHVRTQAELAGDENLKTAAIGYLDARHRA